MNLSLNAEAEKLITDRVKSGDYSSAEDVVTAALKSLEQDEQFGDFGPGELDALIAEADASGEPLDGEEVLAELRALGKATKDASKGSPQ